jgi:putative redox protein
MTTDDPKPRPPSRVVAEWLGDHRFDSGRPAVAPARFDGDATTGQSPPDALLSALATCSAIDLLDVLTKRRTPVAALRVEVTGIRREMPPRRFTRIELDFQIDGVTVERVHAERGLNLAFERYCTVAASLAPDIELWARVTLNGERGELQRQPVWGGD